MLHIYIDGDACPVKDEAARVAARHGLQVYIVSGQGRRPGAAHVHNIMVGDAFDAADDWIAERVAAQDIVVTADIKLAARCLAKSAHVLNHNGSAFTADNIGSALAMRELHSQLRDMGEIKGHNASFSAKDRSQFLQALDVAVQKAKRDGA